MCLMTYAIRVSLLVGTFLVTVQAQQRQTPVPAPAQSKFAGCYEVVSISSAPSNLPTGGIPQTFELTENPTVFGNHIFQLNATTAISDPARLHHVWSPLHNTMKVQFGWGMGGWQGSLKPVRSNELAGKLKLFCDTVRCGGQKQVVTFRAKRVECAKKL
jgi:hypothetical protein